jgi:hypothetical protein
MEVQDITGICIKQLEITGACLNALTGFLHGTTRGWPSAQYRVIQPVGERAMIERNRKGKRKHRK